MRPRIRTVKPEMRQDERYGRLSYPARELFNGLITMADDEGRFRAPTSAILGHVFPFDDDAPRKLRGWIGEIRASGMVVFYVVDGVPYGAFRHWRRHQKINRPNPSELPPPPDEPDVVTDNSVNDHGEFTDSAGNSHEGISDSSRNDHPLTRGCAFRSGTDQLRLVLNDNGQELAQPQRIRLLSAFLAAHIYSNDPKADPAPESERWLTDMRLLLADRGGDHGEVVRVIDWCQSDSFWRCNVLSPGKLRRQFTQLVLKAQHVPTGQTGSRRENASDFLRAINGGAA